MQYLSIQPIDTVFFRDGKPFSMGEDSFAQGIFPPPPGVIYGALSSTFISSKLEGNVDFSELIIDSKKLSIRSISYLHNNVNRYFIKPLDLIVPKPEGANPLRAIALQFEEKPKFSNAVTPYILTSQTRSKTLDDVFWLEQLSFDNYLNNKVPLPVKKQSDYLTKETKIGIARNKYSGTVADGRLFKMQSTRMQNYEGDKTSFLIGYEDNEFDLADSGWLTLGADRRVAYFEKVDRFSEPSCPSIDSQIFKIYLSTPAVFEKGWYPHGLLKQYNLELLTAAIGRPIDIGGWDLVLKQPKPMLQFVPPGTVYYVKAASVEVAQQVAKSIHGTSISDNVNNTNFKNMGYGVAYIAKTNL